MLTEFSIAVVIVFVCLSLHVAGLLSIAEWLFQHRQHFERPHARIHFSMLMVILFSGLMLLHLAEATIWAAFYYSRELFPDFETSLYYSLVSYTTIGFGDVLLPQRWRLLGAIEGISGVLLCGISTAFIFAVMNAMFKARTRHRSQLSVELDLTKHCKK